MNLMHPMNPLNPSSDASREALPGPAKAGHSYLIDSLGEGKDGVDVYRDVLGGRQRGFQVSRHLVVLVEPGVGAGAVTSRLLLQQLLRQPRSRLANLREVHTVAA